MTEGHLHFDDTTGQIVKEGFLHTIVVTPEGKVYEGHAKSVTAKSPHGLFQVLYRHAPMIALLDEGPIVIETEEGEKIRFHSTGGVFQVLNNVVRIAVEHITQE